MNNPEKALEHFRGKLSFTISPVDLDRELKDDPAACVVVDVRAPADFDEAHVPGSVNLPKER